ncbi:MAG: copper-binding protein, partial [Thaumarchaeota archaeon]|nr:copper-binding protein [Nitrososphaerota archaeon]
MSTRFKGFALLVILVCSIGVAPIFAASPALLNSTSVNPTSVTSGNTGEVTVTTDKASYNDGDKVTISGSTQDYISGTPITVRIISPIGNIVKVDQVDLGSDRTFSTSITATGALWQAAGVYTVKVQFGSPDRTAQTTFQFTGSSVGQAGNTIKVDGTDLSVKYSITNGKVLGIKADTQSKSLIVSIQTTGDGVLTITLPRALINATLPTGQDDKYYVLVDGQEADFQETSTTTTDRTLSIPFTDGT